MKYMIPPRMEQEFEERIERGVEFLDNYFETKDWVSEIDLEALDLNDSTRCVCGQLFDSQGNKVFNGQDEGLSGYDYAIRHVVEHDGEDPGSSYEARREYEQSLIQNSTNYGFNIVKGDIEDEDLDDEIARFNGFDPDSQREYLLDDEFPTAWGVLTRMWTERLEKRKAEMGAMA